MAAKLERQWLQVRKLRLIEQSELHRRNLKMEAENLRGSAQWLERGFVVFKKAGNIQKWFEPRPRVGKKQNSLTTLLRGCALGFRLWKSF